MNKEEKEELSKNYLILNKKTINKIIRIIMYCYVALVCTITLIFVVNINKKIQDINLSFSTDNNINETETLNILSKEYYSNYLATDDNFNNMIKDVDEYVLYFHQENCAYCMEANVFVDKYIQLGYMNYVPIIFLDLESSNSIFDKYNIENTPTAIYHTNNEDKVYTGIDEIWNLFDSLVQNSTNNSNKE